ncbi:MAG TPA: c-type cytochrome [Acidimicrobiales bacterium]|nr:c-type cytochrome [Acidimicrobiales bacterium]
MTVLLAFTNQQKFGFTVVIVLILGVVLFLFTNLRKEGTPPPGSEIELAPNRRPYLDDDEMEGNRLSKALLAGLVFTVIAAVGLPLYWANEPSRQAGAVEGFDKRAVQRGFILFQPAGSPIPEGNIGHFGCGGCHGTDGQGGSTQYVMADPLDPTKPPRKVTWVAPALNTVLLRFDPDEVRTILVYGRANTPMPAWGILGGGPMNDQQIDDLVAYLGSIQLKPEDVQKKNMELYGTDGAKLFDGMCSRCHTQGWSIGEPLVTGGGAFGPNLRDGDTIRQFPDKQTQIDFVTEGGTYAKPYGQRGVAGNEGGGMPGFGKMLTPEQIQAIVDYERTL